MSTRETETAPSSPAPLVRAEPALGPVRGETGNRPSSGQRLAALDLIRGFAILGILLANIPDYSNISDALGNRPGSYTLLDRAVAALTLCFIQGKFVTLLAILFGVGLAIQADAARRACRPFTGYYVRRMLLLFGIGLAHALLLWYGDILTSYALVGLAALLLSRLSQRGLLVAVTVCWLWAFGWLTLVTLGTTVAGEERMQAAASAFSPATPGPDWVDWYMQPENQVQIYQQGPFRDMVVHRALFLTETAFGFWIVTGWYLLGCFLLGVYLLRRGVFHNPDAHRSLWRRFFLLGLLVGVPCHIGAGLAYAWEPDGVWSWILNGWGALALALGYLALLVWWSQSGTFEWLQRRLRAVGRLALTNYLLQSFLCSLIFYSYGLRLFGRLGRTEVLAVVLLIWLLQLLVSPWWLRRFHMGPVERLWRGLASKG